jgi:hypothetical protein
VRTALFEVRFDSLPSGGVFAEGHAAELCRTPCTFHIDPADGGPTDHRGFVVKRAGYLDGPITVDLAGTTREFRVSLRQASPPPVAEHTDARPDKRPGKHPGKTTRQGGGSARDSSARDAGPTRDTTREVKDTRDPDPEHLLDPTEARPAIKKPAGKPAIDPADTLDPFHKK